MSAEITATVSLAFSKGGDQDGIDPGPVAVTMTGTQHLKGRQSIGTTAEALILGEVVAGGWLYLQNKDATNYITVRAAAGAAPLIRMRAGEPCLFRLDAGATAPFLQANTAACEVVYLLLSD